MQIENLTWQECILRYDRPHTLFYIDPPYWGHENDYGNGMFGRGDFRELARLLGRIRGKFLMSINDLPEVREIFKGFHIQEVKTRYSAARNPKSRDKVQELLIGVGKL